MRLPRLFRREQKSAPDVWAALIDGGAQTAAGVSVSPETALRCPAVYAAVGVIAQSVAQLPLHLYARRPDGGKERADHPLAEVLLERANDWTTAFGFRMAMQQALLLHGNAYAIVVRAGGQVRELVQVPSASVTVEADGDGVPAYTVTAGNGARRTYDRADVLHIRLAPDPRNPLVGTSPVQQCREAIALSLVLEQHGSKLFANGAKPSGVLMTDKHVTPEVLQRLRAQFDAAYSGTANAGRSMLLESGLRWAQLSMSSVDAEYTALRRYQLEEIARVYRVQAHKLGHLERSTFSNIAEQNQEFLTDCLLPHLENWQQAISMTLLSEDERKTLFPEFLIDDLIRADIRARFEAYSQAITNGILSPNEVRQRENLPAYEGGDEYRRPMNTEVPGQPQPAPQV